MEKSELNSDPFQQFDQWYEEALSAGEADPAAMTLSTVSLEGRPSARIVLYKGIDQGGFLFFTNYNSRKSTELLENPFAALTFYWPKLYRQVRIEGRVAQLTDEQSGAYFQTRPYESQISAWASRQSQLVESREALVLAHAAYRIQFPEASVPCPDDWGGFRLIPDSMEFWVGQAHRLHDRFRYKRKDKLWHVDRLAP